jgi:hypothetical protein
MLSKIWLQVDRATELTAQPLDYSLSRQPLLSHVPGRRDK